MLWFASRTTSGSVSLLLRPDAASTACLSSASCLNSAAVRCCALFFAPPTFCKTRDCSCLLDVSSLLHESAAACSVMASIVMAYIVMAYIIMAMTRWLPAVSTEARPS